MYTSTFMFEAKEFDDEFHRLNDEIAEQARQIPGWLGEESWHNEQTGLHSEVYYWENLDALKTLIGLTEHRVAKAEHARWIGEYRVVIAEVLSTYGKAGLGLEHVPSAS
jgi:heme-degrading monooxygenase HmoA